MTENSKWFDLLSRFLMPMAAFLNNSRYLQTLRDAFMLAFPITMFGSLIVVVANLPFLEKFMSPGVLDAFKTSLGNAPSATMGIMSLFVVFGIGYYLSKSYDVEAVFGGVIALVSFLLLTPFFVAVENVADPVGNVIPLDRLGAKGMFLAMITGFLAGEIYRFVVQKKLDDQNAGRCSDSRCQVFFSTRSSIVDTDDFPRNQYCRHLSFKYQFTRSHL